MVKGESFEIEVHKSLVEAIESGEMGIIPNSARVERRKKYYFKDRGRDITVDIVIEVSRADATTPFL